jgi:uncharacterized protein (UPF0332 family)
MSPRDFLNLADTLVMGSEEAEWRTGMSRAYYAAFHVARALLRQCGFQVPNGEQAHGYIWLRLANCGHPDVQVAASDLKDLRRTRNLADYDLNQPVVPRFAIDQVHIAYTIIELLETVAATPTVQSSITDVIKSFERDVLREVTWHP